MTIVNKTNNTSHNSPDDSSSQQSVSQMSNLIDPHTVDSTDVSHNEDTYNTDHSTGGALDRSVVEAMEHLIVNESSNHTTSSSEFSKNTSEIIAPCSSLNVPLFPHKHLAALEDKIANCRWVIPVLPEQEFEIVLDAAIELCRAGEDSRSEACQRFFQKSLSLCIEKMIVDDTVSNYKHNIHQCIFSNCLRIIELCVLKLSEDNVQFLDYLNLLLNPCTKFHMANAMRLSGSIPPGSTYPNDYLYARPFMDNRNARGWLVDMINKFGELGGFDLLLKRFQTKENLTIQIVYLLLRPFGPCSELLTRHAIETYFIPIVDMIPDILENITDEELKRQAKNESKNDNVSTIIKACRRLVSKVPNEEEKIREFEMFRLKMLLRLLQISSFNGKMNALNEVNKLISDIYYFSPRHSKYIHDTEEWITSERMAQWIKNNHVLEIVLRDSLHQPQYVEKLEKILRFVIKENALTIEDLDALWAAQCGKHEAIVKNVHDLLAKLAWDFSPEQLDHLFSCFQASWSSANKKQSENLLELIRRLAEDDKDGVMANKVLILFWNLAHREDVLPDILDQALVAHVKILDYSCSQERNSQKIYWLDRCLSELKENNNWVVPALKLIREICNLYESASHSQPRGQLYCRQDMLERLEDQYSVVALVTQSLVSYVESVRKVLIDNPNLDPNNYYPDKRYNHNQQIQERLNFLHFLLKESLVCLYCSQAKLIWQCLVENSLFISDRELCFKWFSKIMAERPEMDPKAYKEFFESNIMQFDPTLLTESGMRCFERFFKAVNCKDGKMKPRRRRIYTNNSELIGTDYLWRVLANTVDAIANRAIELLTEVYTSLGMRLTCSIYDFHETHISECIHRLRAHYDTITALCSPHSEFQFDELVKMQIQKESLKMCRIIKVLWGYISEYDYNYKNERKYLPLSSCSFSKKTKSHGNNFKLDFYSNGEVLKPFFDKRLVFEYAPSMTSTPDTSSDDDSLGNNFDGMVTNKGEDLLPGVIMSRDPQIVQFFFQIADKGIEIQDSNLRDSARNILETIPPDKATMDQLYILFSSSNADEVSKDAQKLSNAREMFFCRSPSQVLYNLKVLHAILLSSTELTGEKAVDFEYVFVCSKDVVVCYEMLTKSDFLLNADIETKRAAYIMVFKICKLVLYTIGCFIFRGVILDKESVLYPYFKQFKDIEYIAAALKQLFYSIVNQYPGSALCTGASKITQRLIEELADMIGCSPSVIIDDLKWKIPTIETIRAMMKIAWACAGGNTHLLLENQDTQKFHELLLINRPVFSDIVLCREAVEALSISMILNRHALLNLTMEDDWATFVIDVILLAHSECVRTHTSEELHIIYTNMPVCPPLLKCITMLFDLLNDKVVIQNAQNTREYFQLLSRLLGYIQSTGKLLPNTEDLLQAEVDWLKNLKNQVLTSGDSVIEDTLVTGHLSIMKELISSVSSEVKYRYGSDESANINMIKELMEDFLFPSSKALTRVAKSEDFLTENVIPLCRTPNATEVAFDILVIFCKECLPNLRLLIDIMYNLFYSESNIIPEWDYLPPIGLRGPNSFVGLKNAGATCYMNSVLQQLFMIDNIRVNILAVEGAATDIDEDLSGEEPLFKYRVKTLPTALPAGVIGTTDNVSSTIETTENNDKVPEESRKDYHVNILKQIQAIFGHLTYSKLQYYVPRGLWRYFRLHGEIVNLREQQDAVEFFMSLIDCIDEALKTLNYEQIMSKTLVGSYSDQKICRECPHRYYKEEPFSVLSVDIRNQSNLLDSLEQYVKGELLEGVDAYHCDKCDKKVVTMKRLCVKKLPPVLTIQLKRFEYDYERVCAIKYNDYFEFPRYIDMEPYTVSGLAKAEGEQIDCDDNDQDSNGSSVYNDSNEDYENPTEVNNAGEKKKLPNDPCTKYQLTGVIVHSGQAAGGHYYSFIKCRLSDGSSRWFKFDDGDVSECRMDEDEEMKNQCFGGDYVVERLSYRKQKRWWNAYMLFYTRLDHSDGSLVNQFQNNSHSLDGVGCDKLKMPKAIEISIRRLNIKYTHLQNQFCQEFFHFIRRVCVCNNPPSLPTDNSPLATSFEDYSYLVTQLLARFLFAIGFRTKKIVRGAASEWCELLLYHIRAFRSVRIWFTINILLAHPNRFEEYILISPISEVRNAFVKLISTLANTSLEDAPPDEDDFPSGVSYNPTMSLSDHIIVRVLELLNGDICEYVRHVSNFFSFFYMYMQSRAQRIQLLKLNVPVLFMMLITDECPAPILKYQPNEFLKCHFTVSTLVRSCSVKSRCCSATSLTWEDYYSIRVVEDDKIQDSQQFEKNNDQVMPNPYSEYLDGEELMPLPPLVADTLYNRFIYLKKVMLESQGNEDIVKLIQFICWENPFITKKILLELLYYLNDMYLLELKHITDFIVAVLQMEDSWQIPKIFHTLNGMGDERDGIFEIFNSHRLNQTKRSYFCVKLLVELFSVSQVARNLLHSNLEMKINVWYAVHWLKDQVSFYNRTFMGSPEYSFLWSPGHPENYPLERSNSAKKIVEKGFEIVPDSCIPVQYLTAAKRFEECADDSCEVEQPRTNEQQLARSDSCNTEGFVSWYGSKQRDETSSTFTEDPFTLIYQPLDNPQEGHTVRKARMKKSSFYNVITKSAQDISREYNMSRKIENQPEADSPNVVENTDEIAEAVLAISASSTSLDDILPIDTGNEAETNSTQPPATTIENDE